MKLSGFVFVSTVVALAQTQPAVTPKAGAPAPPTTQGVSAAQPSVPPDAVVCEVDGKKYTAAEVSALMADFPPQMQLAIKSDPKKALSYILTLHYLAGEAEKAKLDQQSPLKETLDYQRLNTMAQAQVNQVRNFQFNPTPAETEKYYKENPDRYQEAKIKVIYVAFSANPAATSDLKAKKALSEAEAKAKIEGLRKQLASGADFSKLAQENSDDKESASKGGEFPALKRTSPYPDAIKNAVFALKPGQVSEPLRQPNGFYLIRLEELKTQPYAEVSTQIYEDMKQKAFTAFMEKLQKRYEVKVENPAYFAATAAAVPTSPVPNSPASPSSVSPPPAH